MHFYINIHIDNIDKKTTYYKSFDNLDINKDDIKMLYVYYEPSDYNIFSYELLLNYTNLTHLWLYSNVDKNISMKDNTFYNFISKINLLNNLNTLNLIGYIVENFIISQWERCENGLINTKVLLNNLPNGIENLCFEINLPAENINEIHFNIPLTLKNLIISFTRCWTNEYDIHKNRIKVSKLPFNINCIYSLNYEISNSLIRDYKEHIPIVCQINNIDDLENYY